MCIISTCYFFFIYGDWNFLGLVIRAGFYGFIESVSKPFCLYSLSWEDKSNSRRQRYNILCFIWLVFDYYTARGTFFCGPVYLVFCMLLNISFRFKNIFMVMLKILFIHFCWNPSSIPAIHNICLLTIPKSS